MDAGRLLNSSFSLEISWHLIDSIQNNGFKNIKKKMRSKITN